MQEVVIVSGARTPIGRFGGAFKDVSASELGSLVIRSALEQANIRPDQVDEVVLGNALQTAEAGYAARLASIGAGIPDEVPTIAINRQCSSGLEAINMAALMVKTGEVDIVVAGGIIPEDDRTALKALGVKAVFGPGTATPDIADFIRRAVEERDTASAAS